MITIEPPEYFPDSVIASGFKMPGWIRTFSGKAFSIPVPKLTEICLTDIAHGLAIAPRWGGQSKFHYPVLAHSLYVAAMLPRELQFDGLMHDASEAYLCDLPAPYKRMMPEYKKMENGIMGAISDKYGFSWPPPDLVKTADAIALYEERKALFDLPVGDDVPVMENHAGLNVPKWNFANWETSSTEFLTDLFISHFHAYRKQ